MITDKEKLVNDLFFDELYHIQLLNYDTYLATMAVLLELPETNGFWTKPASKTGVHHPKTSNGFRGNTVHTKQAFWILTTIIDSDCEIRNMPKLQARMLSAILLHDIFKFEGTITTHAQLGYDFIVKTIEKCNKAEYLVAIMVLYHMGKYGHDEWDFTEPEGTYIVDRAITYVHMADYISSRPYLLFDESLKQ